MTYRDIQTNEMDIWRVQFPEINAAKCNLNQHDRRFCDYEFKNKAAFECWNNKFFPKLQTLNSGLTMENRATLISPNQQAVNTTSPQYAAAAYMPKQTRNAFHNYNQQRNDGTDELYKSLPHW